MIVIFLDFNGVLDTYYKMNIIDEDNLLILKNIVRQLSAKIVISSAIKNTYYYAGHHSKLMNYLVQTLTENGIEIYGFTPWREQREDEIKEYLEEHLEIEDYIIIDDDYDFKSMKEHMLKLKPQLFGGNGLKELEKEKITCVLRKLEKRNRGAYGR